MLYLVAFTIAAALSFASSLLAAALLGPEAFGRYAVALSVSVVINTVLFEWLRLSTTRFYSERVRQDEPRIETTLNAVYAVTSAAVVAIAAVLLVSGADLGLSPGLLAAAAAVGLSVALFDYRTAQARARFLDRRYAALLFGRGLLAFCLAAGAAWLWREPTFALLGSAAAAALTLGVLRETRGPAAGGHFDRALLTRFARYAVPLVAATAIYQALPLLNRAVLAGRSGFAEAGYFSLASEIAVRLLQNVGSALDLALFQLAVRAEERDGREAGERRISQNLGIVFAITVPACVGLAAVWPSFEALFVPTSFRGQVADVMMLAIPAFGAYALVQFGLNPAFQIRHRTGPVVAAAAAALAVNVMLLLAWPGATGAVGVAAVQFASLAVGLLVLAVLALGIRATLPWRDLAFATGAAAIMGAALWPWRDALPPLPGLMAQVLVGAGLYGAITLLFDIAGARSALAGLRGFGRRASIR